MKVRSGGTSVLTEGGASGTTATLAKSASLATGTLTVELPNGQEGNINLYNLLWNLYVAFC